MIHRQKNIMCNSILPIIQQIRHTPHPDKAMRHAS